MFAFSHAFSFCCNFYRMICPLNPSFSVNGSNYCCYVDSGGSSTVDVLCVSILIQHGRIGKSKQTIQICSPLKKLPPKQLPIKKNSRKNGKKRFR
ncbi:hypothetical protein GHT06_022097 [Daphnia sinensis]|uniref:Uncharacterized protein n=1 Tax=Daphnia sinensis TaxID=1820382 RepID=A0AAD5PLC2_9CRUS|nr:hypothetical protein GHT06_022097 [Daphnia sinensis]